MVIILTVYMLLIFAGSPFFRHDTRLRALRFLDHMLVRFFQFSLLALRNVNMQILELKFLMMCLPFLQERDNMQKSEFLKALSDMWKDFDSRVLRYKVCSMLFGYEIYVFSLLLVNFVSRLSPSIHNLYSPASIYNPGYSCCQLLCLVPYNFNSQYGLSSFHGF